MLDLRPEYCFARGRAIVEPWSPAKLAVPIGGFLLFVGDHADTELMREATARDCNDRVYDVCCDSFRSDGLRRRRRLRVVGVLELSRLLARIEAEGVGGVGGINAAKATVQCVCVEDAPEQTSGESRTAWWKRYQMSGASDAHKDDIYLRKSEEAERAAMS